jgi:hypothetical protein
MTITRRPTRILVLFTVVSLNEGGGAYHAAVARGALRRARPAGPGLEKSPAMADYFALLTGDTAEDRH